MRERGPQLLDGRFSESCCAANTAILQSRGRGHVSGLHSVMNKEIFSHEKYSARSLCFSSNPILLALGRQTIHISTVAQGQVVTDGRELANWSVALTSSALRWKMLPCPNEVRGSDERYNPPRIDLASSVAGPHNYCRSGSDMAGQGEAAGWNNDPRAGQCRKVTRKPLHALCTSKPSAALRTFQPPSTTKALTK
jgi:hypothetical protein